MFTFQFSSASGAGDIRETWQVVHQSGQYASSCVVGFYVPALLFVLWDDSGTGAPNEVSAPLGSTAILENSQCRLHMNGVDRAGIGNSLTVVLPLEFKAGYYGPKSVYSHAKNAAGVYSSQTWLGSWTPAPRLDSLTPPAAPIGTPVTLNGLGFGSSGTVSFNGQVATVDPGDWTNVAIVATVPPGTTSGPVVVTVSGQPSNSRSFVVEEGPYLSSRAPTWGPAGTAVTITGTNFGSPGTVTFAGATGLAATQWTDTRSANARPTQRTGSVSPSTGIRISSM